MQRSSKKNALASTTVSGDSAAEYTPPGLSEDQRLAQESKSHEKLPSPNGEAGKTGIVRYPNKALSRSDISSSISQDFRHYEMNYVSAKGATFEEFDFSYSVMTDCYFHNARFINCKFTGARFFRCNFREANFERCDFSYIDANETKISADEIIANLPDYPNIAREILQVMRRNANSLGDVRDARRLVICELDQRKEHLRRAIRGQGEYYKKKYGGFGAKFKLIAELSFLKLDSFAWGHGEKIWKMIFPILLLICASSAVDTYIGWKGNSGTLQDQTLPSFIGGMRYYSSIFLSVDVAPASPRVLWIEWIIAVVRLIALGMLISSLFRWLSHR